MNPKCRSEYPNSPIGVNLDKFQLMSGHMWHEQVGFLWIIVHPKPSFQNVSRMKLSLKGRNEST